MGTISIRGIDDELATLLKQEALASKKSLNQLVLDTLRKHTGIEKEKHFTRQHHDIDHLFGKWSQAEFDDIQGKIDSERLIDPELWK
ncbi:MAG: antitoxin [Proteobacteria bacterium]|nr:antitoxin [Pseudomonadota bacterium]MBU1685728.1 antitoxin [Pseudomonadota bacterium]